MFARKIRVEYDNGDDTLPVADGLLEIGSRVPLDLLGERLTDWFRRKGYLAAGGSLHLSEL
jgi:hypothetical protein